MNIYKKYSIITIAISPVLFTIYIVLMLIVDPLQLFHQSYFDKHNLKENMRHQAAGIINSYDFDGVILGNSYMENTSSEVCSTLLGEDFVNISLGGSSNYERSIVLDYALEKKDIQTVITVIDTNTNRTGSQSYPFELWGMLYDENRYNDFLVYFDVYYFMTLFTPKRDIEFGRPNAWHKDNWYTSRLGGIDNWLKNKDNRQISDFLGNQIPTVRKNGPQLNIQVTEERKKEINQFIADVMGKQAQQNPDTRFIYIFPPFSRLYYAYNNYKGTLEEYFYWHEAMVIASEKWKNIEIYAFANESYVDDIKNYIDTNHFDEWINTSMMEMIKVGQNRLTRENLNSYLKLFKENTKKFDFEGLSDYIIKSMKQ